MDRLLLSFIVACLIYINAFAGIPTPDRYGQTVLIIGYMVSTLLSRIICEGDTLYYSKVLIFISVIVLGCSTANGTPQALSQNTPSKNMNKIDPSILIEIKKHESIQQADQEIEALIRTKREVTAVEKGVIEKEGGRIGSVIGDIVTVRVPVKALSKIADLDFVIYIEKAKKQQLR